MSSKFFNLFKSKKNRQQDKLDDFMQKHESLNKKRSNDPLENNATACYHTDVAPRTRRGPKSMPGGDSADAGHVNRSFETEVSRQRRRAPSPDNFKENRRHRAALSDFNGPVSSRRTDIDYRNVVIEEESDEECDVKELKAQLHDMKKKFTHAQLRRHQYKQMYQESSDMRKRTERAYGTQEDIYKNQIDDLKRDNDHLRTQVHSLTQQLQNEQRKNFQRQPTFNFPNPQYPPYQAMSLSVSSRDTFVSDPHHSVPNPFTYTGCFAQEDRGERKVFTQSEPDSDISMRIMDSNMDEE